MSGIERIARERERQLAVEGWTSFHDDAHSNEEMAMAAACYATPVPIKAKLTLPVNCGCREAGCSHSHTTRTRWDDPWPWAAEWDKRKKHTRIRCLEIAGALIAAEIDRLERRAARFSE